MKEYHCDICRKKVSDNSLYMVSIEYPLFWFSFDDKIEVCMECRKKIIGFIKQMKKEGTDETWTIDCDVAEKETGE